MKTSGLACGLAFVPAAGVYGPPVHAQGPRTIATPQKIDEEYAARIRKARVDRQTAIAN